MDTIQYDTKQTAEYMKDSHFIIHGFIEHWFLSGKLVHEIKHISIPQGMTPGYSSENIFEIDQDMVVYLRKKKFRLNKGDKVMREVIAICGRLKN